MLKKTTLLAGLACLASALVQAQTLGNGYLFLTPGTQNLGSRVVTYFNNANSLDVALDGVGPAGGYQVLVTPTGSKYYLLGTAPNAALQSMNSSFALLPAISGLPSTPTAMTLTPDGKYLVVGGTEGAFTEIVIVDTATNTVVGSPISATGTVTAIAVSRNSTRAYVLSNTAFTSYVSTYDVTTRTRIGNQLILSRGGSGITLSPLGRLYVTANSRIFEIIPTDPNLALATGDGISVVDGGIATVGELGPLKFTPDGSTAYAVNSTPNVGGSLLKFTASNRSIAFWPNFGSLTAPRFSEVLVASNDRVFAYSPDNTTLWDVTPSPYTVAESSLGSLLNIRGVLGAALSNEVPNARYLFLNVGTLSSTTLYRIDLSTNTQSLQLFSSYPATKLSFVSIPQQTAAKFYLINKFQTTQAATTATLVARVVDSANRPVYNAPVTFANANASNPVLISNPNAVTDGDGYVQTQVTAPSDCGPYNINVSSGSAFDTFTISVPGTGCAGGGGGNGGNGGGNGGGGAVTQVQKIAGDGQIVAELNFIPIPLTVKVTDLDGKPVQGAQVNFSTTSLYINTLTQTTTTDENGLAYGQLTVGQNPPGETFITHTVTASTAFGTADFYVTGYRINAPIGGGSPSVPTFDLLKPTNTTQPRIVGRSGELLIDAIAYKIFSGLPFAAPMPKIGLRLSDSNDDPNVADPISCEGNPLSDATGEVHCNVRVGCIVGSVPFLVHVGEAAHFSGQIEVTAGGGSKIELINGDNQSGNAGSLLPITLTAKVSDGCGRASANTNVTWSVTQGQATLEQTVSKSDFNGSVTTRVRLGSSPGTVKIQVALATGEKYVFTATSNVVTGSVRLVSGDGQSVLVSTQFGSPFVFEVRDINNNPISSATVSFGSTGGVVLGAPSGITDAQGRVSVTATAGATAGNGSILASFGSFTATANVTIRPPGPVITAASFLNAASESTGLAVCGLGIVKGAGLAPNVNGIVSSAIIGPLSYTLAGLSMSFNGIPVPLQSVSNLNGVQQVNFQIPCELSPGTATAVISINGSSTTIQGVSIVAAKPGIFTYAGPNNRPYGAVIRALDGSYVTPSNLLRRGETYYLVVTGLGQTTPSIITNSAGTGTQNITLPFAVGVNNVAVTTGRAYYLTGTIGVYLVEFQVPVNTPTGTEQLLNMFITVNGGAVFSNAAFLPGIQ